MCGIIFVMRHDGKPARRVVAKRYQKQKTRGQLGFGFISIKDWKIKNWCQSEREEDILNDLEGDTSPAILFHHRMPTSTPNVVEATHPIRVTNDLLFHDYYFIHNGIINNAEELKTKHNEQGFAYTTELKKYLKGKSQEHELGSVFNDSEALAVDLALYIENLKTTIDTTGSIAFIGLQVDKVTQNVLNVYYGRNHSNPLKIQQINKDISVLASEGGGDEILAHRLHKFNPHTNETIVTEVNFGYRYVYPSETNYGRRRYGYDYEDYDLSSVNHYIDDIKDRKVGFGTTKHLPLGRPDPLLDGEDDEDEVKIITDPIDALAEMYEELAKFEDFYKAAEAKNAEVGMRIWDSRITKLQKQIEDTHKILEDSALKEALEGSPS